MPTFQIQQDGASYSVDAPDAQSALDALNGALGAKPAQNAPAQPPAPASGGFLYDAAKGVQSVGNSLLGLFPNVASDALNLANTLGLTSKTGADAPTLQSVETDLGAPPRPDLAEGTLGGKIGASTAQNLLGTLGLGALAKAPAAAMAAEKDVIPLLPTSLADLENTAKGAYNALREGAGLIASHPGAAVMTDTGAAVGQNVGAPVGQDVGQRIGNAIDGQTGAQIGATAGATVGGYAGALLGAIPGMASVALSRPGGIGIPRLGGQDFGTGAAGNMNSEGATTLNISGSKNTQDLIDKFDTIRNQVASSVQDALTTMQGTTDPATKTAAAENLRNTLETKVLPQVQQQEQAAYAKIENLPVDPKPILADFLTAYNPKVDLAGKPATANEYSAINPFLQQLRNYVKSKTPITFNDFVGRFGLSTAARSKSQHIMSTDLASGTLDQLRGKIIAGIKAQYPDNPDVQNALNITTWKHETFDEGPIGKFLQLGKPDAARTPAGDLADTLMRHPKVGQTMNDIDQRMQSPQVKNDMYSLIAAAHNEVAEARGPQAAQKWYNSADTQQLIKDFPEMKATMDAGSEDLGRALAVQDEFAKNAFMSKYQEDPDLAVQKLLSNKTNSNEQIPQVMSKIQNDPQALRTFREATVKNYLKMFDKPGQNNLQAALEDMGTERTRRNLGQILGSEQFGNLQSILTAMNKMKLGDEGMISAAGRRLAGVAGKVLGASIGPRHMGSGSLIIAGIRAKAGQRIAESLFKNVDPDTIIARAAENPDYRKFILSKVPETKQDVQFRYKQLRRLTALEDATTSGYAAAQQNGGNDNEQ